MYGKRTYLMFFFMFIFFSLLTLRLGYIQLWRGKSLAAESMAIRSKNVTTYQYARGDIVDRNQVPFTNTKALIGVYFLPRSADPESLDKIPALLAKIAGSGLGTATDYAAWQEKLLKLTAKKSAGELILSGISPASAEIILQAKIKALVVAPVYQRYVTPMPAAHTIGYVDASGQGISGIEMRYEDLLHNSETKSNSLRVVLDGRGELIPGLSGLVGLIPREFSQVELSLDKRIQAIVEQELDQHIEKGAAVVMDIKTRDILALCSRPAFDPAHVLPSLLDEQNKPLLNRALEPYNPGSLFKAVTALAFYENEIVEPEESFHCTGHYTFANQRQMACWVSSGHGILSFRSAFAFSCNPVFIECTLRLGRTQLLEAVKRYHLTDETILGYGETLGGRSRVNIDGGAMALANAGLGQDGIWLSPLQITSFIATVADGGLYAPPRLVRSAKDKAGKVAVVETPEKIRAANSEAALKVRQLMLDTVTYGTGSKAAILNSSTAGKTASSQTGRFQGDKEILNVWFGGFFPADHPRYAIVLLKENGSSGANDCAPLFARISEQILELGG